MNAGCAILLAIGQQGKPLDKTVGPLRLIAPNDQLPFALGTGSYGYFRYLPQLVRDCHGTSLFPQKICIPKYST